mmetsp:Transcript_19819/g.51594  ORF Transcript_19819/g.51594 Transcript_19819/m.51594 type:complete len:1313 (+) Transcript_19819:152-4090(+)|eukprot:CAMPEP_0182929610 /NCGR_PEP_ID=MMETSP0105_2-20130417/21995_1 /TAXON_ID=81532 ORGANISM="Acanthoeca-like sp., Strain 10tr" /NCGR_SAMPLE_ID=MMETSP0105_2 /ASSEMBLY_ACC=CAM_ASM_000205 /LENGTH=1312 /DNA_ID=CAMNT_0025067783 /DNA_START=83 /DNA_END=4021 /DNA_ORIENTATION=-
MASAAPAGSPRHRHRVGPVQPTQDAESVWAGVAETPRRDSAPSPFLYSPFDKETKAKVPQAFLDNIHNQINKDHCWKRGSKGTKDFLGSRFDTVDVLLRMCRAPCNARFEDTTTCGCVMPCQVATFEVLARLVRHSRLHQDGLAEQCFPESLIKFLDDYNTTLVADLIVSKEDKTHCVWQWARWLMMNPPDAGRTAVDFDTGVIAQLRRSPVFDLPNCTSYKEESKGQSMEDGAKDTAAMANSSDPTCKHLAPHTSWTSDVLQGALRSFASFLTGVKKLETLPKLPSSWDFFIHYGGFVTFPDAVGIDLSVTELLGLDEAEGKFEVIMDLKLTWFDGSLQTAEWEAQLDEADGSDVLVTSYCAPRVKIKDVLEGDKGWADHNHVVEDAKLLAPGVVTKKISLRSTIRDDNPIHDFPFDAQELTVELELLDADNPESLAYGLFAVPFTVRFEPQHELREWTMHSPVAHVTSPRGRSQNVMCAFRVTRKSTKYLINNMLVLFLLSMLAFYTFVVPIDSADDRGSVTVTLLLTAVSFQQFLSDSLPKMSYLVLLDKYILACFATIFLITIENGVVAYLTGIEKTVSCGRFIPDTHGAGGECVFNNESRSWVDLDLDDSQAVAAEGYFLHFMVTVWFLYNVYFFFRIIGLMHRNMIMFGPPLPERFGDKDSEEEKRDEILAQVIRKIKPERKQRIAAAAIALEKFFWCKRFHGVGTGFNSRHRPPIGSMTADKGGLLSKVRTVEENEVMAVLLNAGYDRRTATALMSAMLKDGLNVERLIRMDPSLVSDLLGQINIPLGKRMDIIQAAKTKQGVMFLQGSASYMMIELGLDGKLVTKEDLLSALGRRLRAGDKIDSDVLKSLAPNQRNCLWFKTTNLANFLYTASLMCSTVTPSMYIISKRTCTGLFGTQIFSQLWAGYGAWIASNMSDTERPKHVLIVDIGSGEMKRFHCVLAKNRPLKMKVDDKDSDSIIQYQELLRTMVSVVTKHLLKGVNDGGPQRQFSMADSQESSSESVEAAFWDDLLSKELTMLGNLLLSKKLCDTYTLELAEGQKPLQTPQEVHFIATSATRAFFEKIKDDGPPGIDGAQSITNPVANAAKRIVLESMKRTLDEMVSEKLSRKCVHVSFRILDHAEEAFHEYAACNAACQHAIDLDPLVKASGLPVSLAWGNGSTQGLCWAPPAYLCEAVAANEPAEHVGRAADKRDGGELPPVPTSVQKEALQVEMGLKKVQSWIREWVECVARECDDHDQDHIACMKKLATGKKDKKTGMRKSEEWISFVNVDARKELESLMRAKIKNKLRGDITTRPIKIFDHAN